MAGKKGFDPLWIAVGVIMFLAYKQMRAGEKAREAIEGAIDPGKEPKTGQV